MRPAEQRRVCSTLARPHPPTPTTRPALPACARYAFNIIFNILNKSALNAFPCPWLISTLQLGEWCGCSSTRPQYQAAAACAHLAWPLTCPLPCPLLVLHAAASGLFMVFLWVTKLQPAPKVDK